MVPQLNTIVQLLRIKQWVKNTFIFFPLLFSGLIVNQSLFLRCLVTFFGFCLLASSVYIINDSLDRVRDRLHPKKAKRILVLRPIRKPVVRSLVVILMASGLFLCLNIGWEIFYIASAYILLHLVYNFYAKQVVIIDVVFVALGFLIRIWAGAAATDVTPSVWLQMCVFLLALFLGFTKRRYELAALRENAPEHRSVLAHYTSYMLDQIIIICSTLAITFYGLYTISPDIIHKVGYNMVYSTSFVIYGMFRYLYLIHVKKMGDDPGEILFSDKPLLINILIWMGYVSFLVYFLDQFPR